MRATVRSLFLVREGRKRKVRILTENDNKIIVRILTASRDKEGKMAYKTFDSIEIGDAKPEEVYNACEKALGGTGGRK